MIKFIGDDYSDYAFGLPTKKQNYGQQRSRRGMIGQDTKKGLKIGGALGAIAGGAELGIRMKSRGGLKTRLAAGLAGTIGGAAIGAMAGGGGGAGVGAGRALLTPRKKKTKLGNLKTSLAKRLDK